MMPTYEMEQTLARAPQGVTKMLHLNRDSEGQVTNVQETVIDPRKLDLTEGYDPFARLTEARLANGRKTHLSLTEALLTQPDAAEILRTGIRFLAFNRFRQLPPSYSGIVQTLPSNKEAEEYLRDAAIGRMPKAPSGTQAPELSSSFEGGVKIGNDLYRGIFRILGDWIKFDKIGKIRQTADSAGRALAMTREFAVFSALTTTGNYTRNSTTNDNDIGANTAATTFNGVGLEGALATVATSKDRKSGNYLGYRADSIVVGPRMEVSVKMLLLSPEMNRQGGNTTNEVRGLGTTNFYRGMLNNIIISPWFGTGVNAYQWLVFDSTADFCKLQEVEAPQVLQEDQNMSSESWLVRDEIRFLARDYFGAGIVDDRAAYYSSSTTAPTVS